MPAKDKTIRYSGFQVHFRSLLQATATLALAATAALGAEDAILKWQKLVIDATNAGIAKDYPKSEELFQRAIQAAAQFQPNDPRVGTTYNDLGLVYKEEKKFADAEKMFVRAVGILEKAYGTNGLDVANVSFNIATVSISQGHYDGALPYIQRSRAIYTNILGEESPKTTLTICMLGDAYRNLKRYTDAVTALKQCADEREAAGGMDNADLGDAMFNLGRVYQQISRNDLAEPALKLAAKIREITRGVTSPEFAEALEAHAELLKIMGRGAEADRDRAMAEAIRRQQKPPH
jgi:tetratricopeptide (TPR) repeat protein